MKRILSSVIVLGLAMGGTARAQQDELEAAKAELRRQQVIVLGLAMGGTAHAQQDELEAVKAELRRQQEIIAGLMKKIEELESKQATTAIREDPQQEVHSQQERINSLEEQLVSKANLTGYYTFEYINTNSPVVAEDTPVVGAFRQHFLSFFISKQINHWTFFSETEFEYGPNFDASAGDFETANGEIHVENAWMEYNYNRHFNVRVGKQLFPQYWQTYHYPSLTFSTQRPINTAGTLFPQEFVGAMMYGSASVPVGASEVAVGYKVYVGNNQVPDFGRQDQTDGKAVGAKLQFQFPAAGRLKKFDVAADVYRGKLANEEATLASDTVWGLDTQIEVDRFLLFGEYARGSSLGTERYGYYLQPGIRLTPQWVAFYRNEGVDDPRPIRGGTIGTRNVTGINFRPVPQISLKVEYYRTLPRLRILSSSDQRNQPTNGFATSLVFFF